ncbi:hypothetical protein D3C71_1777710 [compost metagenome]
MPLVFCSSRVKPVVWPKPRIGGGASTNTVASRRPDSALVTRPISASALPASVSRCDQSTRLTNPWPEFCDAVGPPPPATMKAALMSSDSFLLR